MPTPEKNQLLNEYRSKRSRDRTPEPFGGTARGGALRFVVQHHAARALHYDFRLELDGVLKSWAVPKGPSPNPADKRLAVRTEDHPLDYADFEGRIPEDNYGAGSVIVWDRGSWRAVGDPVAGLANGKLLFELHGYKLRGRWTLVKTRRGVNDWLLIKERDAYVDDGGTETYPADSILSGRTVTDLQDNVDPVEPLIARIKELGVRSRRPIAVPPKPMLAKAAEPFSKRGWIFEFKYDGYRLAVFRNDADVTLYSRNGHDLSQTFPEIADVARALPFRRFVLDGEAVVHDEQGFPSFSALQTRGRLTRRADVQSACVRHPATLYAFDLLEFDGFDVRRLPLVERKALLRKMLPTTGPLRYSDHIAEHGDQLYGTVINLGLEGMLAKRADSAYRAGRSADWLKMAARRRDDFVVAGYTRPQRGRRGFGALLLGQFAGSRLTYAGRVGSGFSDRQLAEIRAALDAHDPGTPPAGAPAEPEARWIEPVLVCEIEFKEVTADGVLRAPVFVRLRDDKAPQECLRPQRYAELAEPELEDASLDSRPPISLTNLDKVFWPSQGYTKGDLIQYYRTVAHHLLPYLSDRPVVLTRLPDGIEGKSFFQKDAPDYVPDWLRTERIWSESAKREISYFVINDDDSLVYVANMGSIPLHIWSSRISTLERPDWCVLDLDPKDAPFHHVLTIARAIHSLGKEIDMPLFVKTSGSTGMHILIPLGARYTYDQSRSLGELLATLIVHQLPDIATVVRAPGKRAGKVYIDYLQNRHGQTIAAPFCVRPLPGAPVSMPVQWREVNSQLTNPRFTIKTAVRRVARWHGDPMREVLVSRIDLAEVLSSIEGLLGRQRKGAR